MKSYKLTMKFKGRFYVKDVMKKLICDICGKNNTSMELRAITELGLLHEYRKHIKKDHPQEFMNMNDMTKAEKDEMMNNARSRIITE